MAKSLGRLEYLKLRNTIEFRDFVKQQLKLQEDKCKYCQQLLYKEELVTYINRFDYDGNRMPPVLERYYTYTVDHVTPLHVGGSNDFDNFVIACSSCNSRKSWKLDWSFS